MLSLSERIKRLKPSATIALSEKARELRASGKDIINLSLGELDYTPPTFMKEAAIKAIQDNHNRYTPVNGILALRQAIAQKLQAQHGVAYSPNSVCVSTGAKQALFNICMALLNPGDEVVLLAPYWVSYPHMVEINGGVPVVVETSAQDGFKPTAEGLEQVITPKTKAIILNSPNNPSGVVYTRDDMQAIAQVLRKHPHVAIVCDDIYQELVYGDAEFTSLLQVAPDLKDRTFTVNGWSKSHAVTGWRMGYAVGPEDAMKAISKIQSQSTSGACCITQHAALAAIENEPTFLNEWRNSLNHKRRLFSDFFNQNHMPCVETAGAFYLFPNVEYYYTGSIQNDDDMCAYLLENADVSLVPGSAFGTPHHVRFSYAPDEALLTEGCNRLLNALKKLKQERL